MVDTAIYGLAKGIICATVKGIMAFRQLSVWDRVYSNQRVWV